MASPGGSGARSWDLRERQGHLFDPHPGASQERVGGRIVWTKEAVTGKRVWFWPLPKIANDSFTLPSDGLGSLGKVAGRGAVRIGG